MFCGVCVRHAYTARETKSKKNTNETDRSHNSYRRRGFSTSERRCTEAVTARVVNRGVPASSTILWYLVLSMLCGR